jgi:hypothetical protein
VLYVITGPPAAGKSSWIDAHAKPEDIVIDLDRITLALTGPGAPQWNQAELVVRVAQRARYAAIDEAVKHRDKVDVYLIHTRPKAKALARYKQLGARVVAVDPGRDVVMKRIEAMRSPEMKRVATAWYNDRQRRAAQTVTQSPLAW